MEETVVKHRVLVTGFGPFGPYKENPSWLAVKPLHDTLITTEKLGAIHVTTLNIPTSYTAILDTVPLMHAAPPMLPAEYSAPTARPLPEAGFDFVLHVGVWKTGGLSLERLGHKTGFTDPDAFRAFPPAIAGSELRGFSAPRYGGDFADELHTPIDVDALMSELTSGAEPLIVGTSNDPGRFGCDFLYYCSLAESKIAGRGTPVLFVHIPPIGKVMSTEDVTAGLQRLIPAVLAQLSR
ncbi:hypothetical protein DFH09DRAFT_1478707 [Mycena vulgaris]|nr:hypothetical protein DFH09DRAFT_1478707 [Mycena vulgaris]